MHLFYLLAILGIVVVAWLLWRRTNKNVKVATPTRMLKLAPALAAATPAVATIPPPDEESSKVRLWMQLDYSSKENR